MNSNQQSGETADHEAEELLRNAREDASQLLASYKAQSDRTCAAILSQGEQAARARSERLAEDAAADVKKAGLSARQELMSHAFSMALERLCSLPDDQLIPFLAGIAANASETGEESVLFNQKDRNRIGKEVVTLANELLGGGKLTVARESGEFAGGLILNGGDVELNGTFEALIGLAKTKLSIDVSKLLFDQ
ncbi:MAG: hypothetical protein H6Q60_1029 [Oscillospiraceae bacterium]|nr:hypothetical protein [Oscillospiraceae bacterium]